MPPLRPRLPALCSFLYPSPRTPLGPLPNLQPCQPRKYVTKTRHSPMRNDLGLVPGI